MTSIQNELQTISIAETSKLSEECNENSVQQKKDFCNNEIENSQNCCYRHPKHKSSCTTNIGNKLNLIIKNMNFVCTAYLSWFEVTSGFSTNSNSDSSSRFTIAVATVSPLNINVLYDFGSLRGSLWILMAQNHRRHLLSFHLAFSIVLNYHFNACKFVVAHAN